jgi:hypothetical protein
VDAGAKFKAAAHPEVLDALDVIHRNARLRRSHLRLLGRLGDLRW